jgi:iron complex outermembrane receptor protein
VPRTPLLFAALTLATSIASAQRADVTAAAEADDAFGLSVAGETIGLYSDKYVRGFSPVNAGNLRLDGLYIDRQGEFTERLFADVAVRVGATALETPLPAPSGVADYSLRRPGADALLSMAGGVASFGSPFIDLDWTVGGDVTEAGDGQLGAILYPERDYGSWSGELQAARDFKVAADWRASLLLSLRGRDVRVRAPPEADPVQAPYQAGGPAPPLTEPGLDDGPDDRELVRQLTPGAMMRLAWRDRLELQLGVQRADYRREVSSGVSGQSDAIDEQPWMGAASASFALDNGLRAYAAYARGFEDSGTAPGFAENAGEVLPASRTQQWDAGLRWPLGRDTDLVVSVFRLERPNRALDADGRFGLRGLVRNDGLELSVVSHAIEGLSVIAGLLMQRPRMVDAPEGIGPLAVAIAEYTGIVEVDYEPARWRGFGIGISVATNGPAEAKADNGVETESYTTLDLGLRYSFEVRNAPVSVRASVTNVTDEFAWEAQDDEGFRWIQQRAFQLVVATDIR